MTRHSLNNNTPMGFVISPWSNSNHLISLIPPAPQTSSNFRHLLGCDSYSKVIFLQTGSSILHENSFKLD